MVSPREKKIEFVADMYKPARNPSNPEIAMRDVRARRPMGGKTSSTDLPACHTRTLMRPSRDGGQTSGEFRISVGLLPRQEGQLRIIEIGVP